ncbi:MAG: TonB-dependent receptor [Flavobacteriales bacterium]|nr:TonB-dependent receptor [Flavobacteriales bacterium]
MCRKLQILTLIITGILFTGITGAWAQGKQVKFTVSGHVTDEVSGEDLPGASVYIQEVMKGTATNTYGFYSLTLESGTYNLVASYMGYEQISQKIVLNKDLKINIKLKPFSITTDEVVVTAERKDKNVESTEMGKVELQTDEIKTLPVVFGEVDVLKTIQLLPGVQSAGEGSTGFYVRGGGPDQNLILLDEATVYNAGHLLGFFSVFNADAIKSTTLIKGGMPANYGGRLSSVLDINMKDGNNQSYHGEGGIGLIASRMTLEGPIKKNDASFIISGRRTYVDVLSKPFLKNTELGGIPYFFYDLNAKVNYKITPKDRVYLSGYFGRDIFDVNVEDGRLKANINWGNATTTLRWNHLFNDKLFMNMSGIYNSYDFKIDAGFDNFTTTFASGIKDWNQKTDFFYYPNINHNIKFGYNYTYHIFSPRTIKIEDTDGGFNAENVVKKYSHETALYVMDDFSLTDKLKVNAGLRGAYFIQKGPFTLYEFDNNYTPIDSTRFRGGEKVADFWGLEPRLSLRYALNSTSSLKAGFTYNNQFVHLVSNSYTTLPMDIWVPSSILVKPQKGTQYSGGYFRNFKDNMFETSVELYYKNLRNQIEFNESYTGDVSTRDIEYEFTYGDGYSYGMELFLKKATGKAQGWIGYTLSKTARTFEHINKGNEFPARFDRTHDLSVVGSYKLNDRWTFSGVFVYGTGQATTMPERYYLVGTDLATKYGPRNGFRMEPYHRMDISAILHSKKKEGKKFSSEWAFSIYNVYNRKNPFFYYIANEGDPIKGDFKVTAKKVYIFPILPSVSWNFKF